MTLRHEDRDVLIVTAAKFVAGETISARAREMHRRMSIYFDSARWKRDRIAERCPYQSDTFDAAAWHVLKFDWKVLSEDRLGRIIAEFGVGPPLAAPKDVAEKEIAIDRTNQEIKCPKSTLSPAMQRQRKCLRPNR